MKKHPWLSAAAFLVAALAIYYVTIPIFGPHFAKVCGKGEYGPPDSCTDWDAVTASVLLLFNWLDGHNGIVAAMAGVVVAVFTAVLWHATDKLWAVSQRQHLDSKHATYASQVTARAAQRQSRAAAKTLEISVRPVVRPSGLILRYDTAPRMIVFELVNAGSGPAILKDVQAHGTIGSGGRLLFSFGNRSAFQTGDEGMTIEAGGEPLGPIEMLSGQLNDAAIHSLLVSHESQFSLRIVVNAEDILGNPMRRATVFNWDHGRRGFMPHLGLPRQY